MTTSPPSPSVRRAGAFALAAVAALSTWGSAASRADDPPTTGPDGLATVKITDGQPVTDVLRALMAATSTSIAWSPDDKAIMTKKIGPAQSLRAPAAKLLDLVRALLVPSEIVLIPMGPTHGEFFWAVDARALGAQFLLKNKPEYVELNDKNVGDYDRQDGLFVSTMIRVANLSDLRDARSALQRLVTPNNIGSVQEVPSARAFVVTDFAPSVASIYRLVRQMDVAQTAPDAPQPTFLRLQHAKAGSVRTILLEQFSIHMNTIPGPAPGTTVQTPAPTESDPRISSDDATNQLVVTARETDLAKIRRIVEGLDVEKAK